MDGARISACWRWWRRRGEVRDNCRRGWITRRIDGCDRWDGEFRFFSAQINRRDASSLCKSVGNLWGTVFEVWFGQSRLLGISLELGSAVAPAFATGSCPAPGSWLTVGVRESSHLEGWTQQGPTHSTNPHRRLIAASGQKQAGLNRASINSPIRQELVVILRLQAKPLTGIYAAHQGSTKASCKTSPSSIGTHVQN